MNSYSTTQIEITINKPSEYTVETGLITQSPGTDKGGLAPPVLDVTKILRPPGVGLEFSVNGTGYDETNQLIHPQLHSASIRNMNMNSMKLTPAINDKIGACCYWSVVIGVSGSIIVATIWSLIHYYY